MLARRTMRTQIITSLVAVSSYPSLYVCVRVRVCVYGCVPFLPIFFSIQCVCVYVCMRTFFVSDVKYLHFLIVTGYYRQRNSAIFKSMIFFMLFQIIFQSKFIFFFFFLFMRNLK